MNEPNATKKTGRLPSQEDIPYIMDFKIALYYSAKPTTSTSNTRVSLALMPA